MKKQFHKAKEVSAPANKHTKLMTGPSLYEVEYLNQFVEELNIFLRSKNVTTIKDIYLGFQGGEYRGQMLISRGA